MSDTAGEALDVALGMLRFPALRASLRARALPDGVGEVLAIASGSSERARLAAERTGYGEAELVEAARFFVQQVLLAEDADAYRVLGATRTADHATLRDHHRLLLRWLHPDRSGDAQWDSALSTRVNQAWNQLRTDVARAQYDAALPPATSPRHAGSARGVASPTPMGVPAVRIAEHPPRRSTAAPVAVALLGLACVALAWLAIHREDPLDDPGRGSAPQVVQSPTLDPDTAPRAADPPRADAMQAAPALPDLRTLETGVATWLEHREAPAPTDDNGREALAVSPLPQGAELEAMRSPGTVHVAGSEVGSPSVSTAETGSFASPAPAPYTAPALDSAALDVAIATAPLPTVSPQVDEHVDPATDPLQLFREAEDAIRSVTGYFTTHQGAEPDWLDLPIGLEAAGLRARMLARHDGKAQRRMELQDPRWTLGDDVATMHGAYRLGGRRGAVETGMLHVELTRQGPQWRVSALALEPAR